jgi:hypothetical protein
LNATPTFGSSPSATSVIFSFTARHRYLQSIQIAFPTHILMSFAKNIATQLSSYWWVGLVLGGVVVGLACASACQSESSKLKRVRQRQERELRALTEKISRYARDVHRRFPTGDVVVSERDLAEQLRKRPEAVSTALGLLLKDRKAERAPMTGYWKLDA